MILVSGCGIDDTPTEAPSDEVGDDITEAPTKKPTDTEPPVAEGPYKFRSAELGHYVIVYSVDNPDNYRAAMRLRRQISSKYGKELPIVLDTKNEPSGYEILVGDTNRTEIRGRVMEYSVTVDEGRFTVNFGGSVSADAAADYLCSKVFDGQELILDKGEYYKTSLMKPNCEITEGTSARVMSANILADKFSNESYGPAYSRAEIFAAMLITHTPDVVGLQEADESWNKVLDKYLERIERTHGISYSRYTATYEDKVNYTSLIYRSDKFKIDDGGVNVFTWWTNGRFNHDYHMRNVSWACLSPVEGEGKSFIVANTHWSYRTEHADGSVTLSGASAPLEANELRVQCKDETDAFMTSLKQSHSDTPIFLTGDFNTSLYFFTQSSWQPKDFGIVSEEAKKNGTALSEVPASGHYDHIFGAGGYSVGRFDIVYDKEQHSELTDHPFVYADLIF